MWLIAADPKSEPAVIDDCFGGALSQDPIHCTVLQLAHNEGIIEVDAVLQGGYLTLPVRTYDSSWLNHFSRLLRYSSALA